MKYLSLFCAFLYLSITFSYAQHQKNELDVRNINIENFPTVSGDLWVRNPKGIEKQSVKFFENDIAVDLKLENLKSVKENRVNKSVLFLVLNSPNETELNWYKNTLKNSIRKGAILKGDKIDVLSFSCKEDEQLLFPNTLNFTDDADELINRIDKIQVKKRDVNCKNKSHIYLAIHEALELYEKENIDLPSSIFVLADDCALEPIFQVEVPGLRSRRLNIPINSISYYKAKTYYKINDLCNQTYGSYFSNNKNDLSLASDSLMSFLNSISQKSEGVLYPFTYTSTLEKDGEVHPVKIQSKGFNSGFALLTPTKNLIEWIKSNVILSVILFILFIVSIVLIIMLFKKNKLKKIEIENRRKLEHAEIERQQLEAERKMHEQELEIQRIKEEERIRQENVILAEKEKLQKIEDEIQLRKMLERGNLPWFEYKLGEVNGSQQINSPRYKVGRDENNNWRINHPTVSRNHFILIFNEYIYTVKDLGSSNGIMVNGKILNEAQLKHGDHIQVGDISLTFHI